MKHLWQSLVVVAAVAVTSPHAQTTPPLPFVVVQAEPASDPWWQRATLNPRASTVRGISVKRLEPAWCAAEAFTRELFGEELLGAVGGNPLEGLTFTLEHSFDGSGRPQTAFVGAYRRCNGEHGLFVAIVDRPVERPSQREAGRQRVRFLVEVPDPGTAFAGLSLEPDGALAVWWCGSCNNGHRIAYNRETRGFFVAGPASRR
jgi:hypothetical protein